MSGVRVKLKKNVHANGAPQPAGAVVKVTPLDAAVLVLDCEVAEFCDDDRQRVIDARRAENRRVCGPMRGMRGDPWHPLNY